MSLALAAINQSNYESALTHDLIGQTASFCSGMITDKIKEYVTLVVKLRKTQQEPSQETIETLIKEMYISHLKEFKTTQHNARPPYFSIAWDRVFALAPPRESHLFFDLAIIREIMNNHAICSTEHDIVAIIPSVFIYFQESILTTSERSRAIAKQDSITILMQERTNIFNRHAEAIAKLASDQACAFLLNCGGILRSLQEACQDINKQIEEVYSRSRTAYKEKSVSGS